MQNSAPPCSVCGRQPASICGNDGKIAFACIHCGGDAKNLYWFRSEIDAFRDWVERQTFKQFRGASNEHA